MGEVRVLLIGDTGGLKPGLKDDPTNIFFQAVSARFGDNVNTIVLGDLVYPKGLPYQKEKGRHHAEQILQNLLLNIALFQGKSALLLGNHDWNKGRSDGYPRAIEMKDWLNQNKNTATTIVFSSSDSEASPIATIEVGFLKVICLDTQRLVTRSSHLRKHDLPLRLPHLLKTRTDLLTELQKHEGRPVLVVGHHPFYSGALHGGRFSTRHHLFPLTALHKRLYLPVPFAGSLYPAYRAAIGAREDMSHQNYKQMRRSLGEIFAQYKNIIYAGGHDHNLQVFNISGNLFLVSGSGSKTAKVYSKKHQLFKSAAIGGFMLTYSTDNQVVIIEAIDQNAKTLFSTESALNLQSINSPALAEN